MATLEKIRRRSGLVVGVIGLALLLFVVGDLFSNGNPLSSGPTNEVGIIGDESITITEFNKLVDEIKMNGQQFAQMPPAQLSEFAWNRWSEEVIYGELYEATGITVTNQELYNLLINDPTMRSAPVFMDENTGRFSELKFNSYFDEVKEAAESDERAAQAYSQLIAIQENKRTQALNDRLNKAVQAAIFTPRALARHQYSYSAISHDIGFVRLDYASVPDSAVEIRDEYYESYYNENKHRFRVRDESRDIAFVNFPIQPSESDKEEVRQEMANLIEDTPRFNERTGTTDTLVGFRNTDDDSVFVLLNSEKPYRPGYFRSGELSSNVDSIMFQAEPGFIYGPYEEAGGYNIMKLQDVKVLPDSATVRHILIAYQTQQNPEAKYNRTRAKELADSLYGHLEGNRADFDSVVVQYSDDPGSVDSGGVYRWIQPRQMVPQFNDFSFQRAPGTLGMVETTYGFHIIEVMEHSATSQKAVKVANVYREYEVSKATTDRIYLQAAELARAAQESNFQDAASAAGMELRTQSKVPAMESTISAIGPAREVVTWAYEVENEDVEVGDITVIQLQNTNSIVVVQLTGVREEGYRPLNDELREEIRPFALNRAKADQVLVPRAEEMMNGLDNINAIAQRNESTNMVLQRISLGNSSITGVGNEPKVVGSMCATPTGAVEGPVVGNLGVYIWQPNASTEFVDKADYSQDQENISLQTRTNAAAALGQALREKLEIVDNRIRFY